MCDVYYSFNSWSSRTPPFTAISPPLFRLVVVGTYSVPLRMDSQGSSALEQDLQLLFLSWLRTPQSPSMFLPSPRFHRYADTDEVQLLARWQIVQWEIHEFTSKYFAKLKSQSERQQVRVFTHLLSACFCGSQAR